MEFPIFGTLGVLVASDDARLYEARQAVDRVLDEIDRACSRFRPDSDLERVNEGAGHSVTVSPVLIDAVLVALRAARRTDGAVDPTVGQALRLLGYDRDFAHLDRRHPPTLEVVSVPGWRQVVVDQAEHTIRIPRGTRLDLGATAKAWAADRAAQAAHRRAGCGVLVSLGGDLAVAGAPPEGGWGVQLAEWCGDPVVDGAEGVRIQTGGVATSSTTVRRWGDGDAAAHHLIDPATARPAGEVWRTATVAAGSCLDANVAATAAIVKGEDAPRWLAERGLPARLVRNDGRVQRVAGWPAPEVAA